MITLQVVLLKLLSKNEERKTLLFSVMNYEGEEHIVKVSTQYYFDMSCGCGYLQRKDKEMFQGICSHKLAVIKELMRRKGKV